MLRCVFLIKLQTFALLATLYNVLGDVFLLFFFFFSFEILCHETFLACSEKKELGDVFIHVPFTHTHTLTHWEILLAS